MSPARMAPQILVRRSEAGEISLTFSTVEIIVRESALRLHNAVMVEGDTMTFHGPGLGLVVSARLLRQALEQLDAGEHANVVPLSTPEPGP